MLYSLTNLRKNPVMPRTLRTSASACGVWLNPFYDMFINHLWKGENPREFTS